MAVELCCVPEAAGLASHSSTGAKRLAGGASRPAEPLNIMLGKKTLVLVLALGRLACSEAKAAQEWPQFRGPGGQGMSLATNVPVRWSATNNIAWSVEVPGGGWSSPVLAGGRVYLTSAVPESGSGDVSLRVLCFDATDGKTLWNVEVLRPDPASAKAMHQKNSQASPTPIVKDGRIYVHFGHMGTAALDLAGKVVWEETEIKYKPVHGNGGSPALVGDKLVFSCDGASDPFVAALDAATGKVAWKTPRNTPAQRPFSFSTPLAIEVGGATQVICPGSGLVGAYDPKTGKELWRARYGEGYSVVPRPVFAHGLLFVSSAFDRPEVFAVKPEGAQGDVTDTHVAWSLKKGAPNTPSMLVVGEELYFVSDGGIASCVDAKTGTVHWSERLGGDFSASPVFAEGRLYFQNEAGVGFVLKAGKTFELLAKNELGERSLASCAVADGTLFIRTKSRLWRVGAANPK